MDNPPSHKINKLIDRLFDYNENHKQIVEHIVSIGKDALPELLIAFRDREFRQAQYDINTDENLSRHISKALVEIAKTEKDPLAKDRLTMQIINEMAVYVKWQIEISPINSELYNKAFDKNLYNKAVEAAWIMGQLKNSSALPHLFEVIQNRHSHTWLKERAIIAVGQIGDEQAIPQLIELIDKHDYNLHFAIEALVIMGSMTAVPHLIASLEKARDDDTKAAIMHALGQLRDPRAIPILTECVKAYQADMKAAAIQALGNLGDPGAIPILETCLEDSTILNRQDWGGTFWLFRTYRQRKICEMALEALKQIGTPDALNIVEKWQSSQANKDA